MKKPLMILTAVILAMIGCGKLPQDPTPIGSKDDEPYRFDQLLVMDYSSLNKNAVTIDTALGLKINPETFRASLTIVFNKRQWYVPIIIGQSYHNGEYSVEHNPHKDNALLARQHIKDGIVFGEKSFFAAEQDTNGVITAEGWLPDVDYKPPLETLKGKWNMEKVAVSKEFTAANRCWLAKEVKGNLLEEKVKYSGSFSIMLGNSRCIISINFQKYDNDSQFVCLEGQWKVTIGS